MLFLILDGFIYEDLLPSPFEEWSEVVSYALDREIYSLASSLLVFKPLKRLTAKYQMY